MTELTETSSLPYYRAFFDELRRLGYIEGRNLTIERYSLEGHVENSSAVARSVVSRNPDLIFTVGDWMVKALRETNSTVPIVMVSRDPVAEGLTQSLAHVQLVHPDDQKRIGELGIYSAFTFVWTASGPEYEMMVAPFIDQLDGVADLYNPDHYYMKNVYPAKSMQDFGGIIVHGSDAPVGSRDPMPLESLEQAITRGNDGVVLNPKESLDIHSAIAAFTINGAKLMGHDNRLGSIEAGKIADIIVLDQNIVELADSGHPEKIGETKVKTTIFDGKVVFERPN